MSVLRETFDRGHIETALRWLDRAIGQSEILADVIPIHTVSYGGMLSVCLFGNRAATKDIDVLLPSNVRDSQVHRAEFTRLVNGVAGELSYMRDWINDDLRLFVPIEGRQKLLEDSIEQGTAVFEGDNLVIWAGVWEFGLESKLDRIDNNEGRTQSARARLEKDTSDAVELVHLLRGSSAHPLDKAWVMGLARFCPHAPFHEAVEAVAQAYAVKYGVQGIVELVWDAAEGKHKYQDLAGQWVWYE
ncbi:64e6f23f-b144-42d0-976c-6157a61357c8 [Thermothielavioides terrestris]|uniref:64e6f23f-b144-42d0-976c-6157a61357c8 n=1 Tax=Thermothielavioides terrestris TaxID=2587410 RepID=A0A3S4B9G6_9PEZI|nr:64e6f23f-b144-42d0-976c-6157a61357c8 [Thermothielavioides terrestris]